MNEKIKKIFYTIGAVIVGIFSGILAILFHNRRTVNRATNDNIDTANTARDTGKRLDDIESRTSNATQQLEHIKQSTRRAETILQTIREKQKINND